jgi:hypothetical protein
VRTRNLIGQLGFLLGTVKTRLHTLHSSANTIRQTKARRLRWARHVARNVEERNVYKVLVEKSKRKRPLGLPRHRWEDVIRMYLREMLGDMEWIQLAQNRYLWRDFVNEVMKLRVLPPRSYLTIVRQDKKYRQLL